MGPLRMSLGQVVLLVKNLPANAGDIRDAGSIPGWGRFPGGGHGNPLQYSCLKNPMDSEESHPMESIGSQRVGYRLKQLRTYEHTMLTSDTPALGEREADGGVSAHTPILSLSPPQTWSQRATGSQTLAHLREARAPSLLWSWKPHGPSAPLQTSLLA